MACLSLCHQGRTIPYTTFAMLIASAAHATTAPQVACRSAHRPVAISWLCRSRMSRNRCVSREPLNGRGEVEQLADRRRAPASSVWLRPRLLQNYDELRGRPGSLDPDSAGTVRSAVDVDITACTKRDSLSDRSSVSTRTGVPVM